ncbi:MAG TPA: J domain-containing protein [Candidatus Limnocylindrales bacterium]
MPPRHLTPSEDLYARLEVPHDATFEAIEIAWRALLKQHHPDVAGADALELAKRINVAHDWLSDPQLRARYDGERLPRGNDRPGSARWGDAAAPGPAAARPAPRPVVVTPAESLRRFLDRVARLDDDELDRLSVAETTSIAFVASIRRFLGADAAAGIDAAEREVRARLSGAAWANGAIRDAVLAAVHEIVLGHFLDEHLTEPFRGRARERLLRGWEAAVDQPRYGPNTGVVERFIRRAGTLEPVTLRALVEAGRGRLPPDPWPRGLDPDEDAGLHVSSALAGRDAVTAAGEALARLDRSSATRAARLLRRTAHALVLRHAFSAAEFAALVAPWQEATADPGTGRRSDERAEATVRRR